MRLVRTCDVSDSVDTWTINGTLCGLTVLWGRPKCGKSFLAVSWAAAVASGQPWMGHTVTQGPVVYVVGEGGLVQVTRRVREAIREMGAPLDIPFYLVPQAVPLQGANSVDETGLAAAVEELPESPTLVVVDTLSRCLIGNENQQEDMAAFVAACDEIRLRWGCTVLVVHHSNKGGTMRGSSVLEGAADTIFAATRSIKPGSPIRIRPTHMKDLDTEDFQPRELEAVVVPCRDAEHELVLDDAGDRVTTLVLRAPEEHTAGHVATLIGAFAILESGREVGKCVGYREWLAQSGLSKSTFGRARSKALDEGGIEVVEKGHYIREGVVPVALGDNYDTDHDEVMDRLARTPEVDEI